MLNTTSKTVKTLRREKDETASTLLEYPFSMVVNSLPANDPVYALMDKKRAQGNLLLCLHDCQCEPVLPYLLRTSKRIPCIPVQNRRILKIISIPLSDRHSAVV